MGERLSRCQLSSHEIYFRNFVTVGRREKAIHREDKWFEEGNQNTNREVEIFSQPDEEEPEASATRLDASASEKGSAAEGRQERRGRREHPWSANNRPEEAEWSISCENC